MFFRRNLRSGTTPGKILTAALLGVFLLAFPASGVSAEPGGGESPSAEGAAAPAAAASEETAATPRADEEWLRFRYWMVPADQIDRWPWGTEKYFPIAAPIFQRWIDDFEQKEKSERSGSDSFGLSELRLFARLDGTALTDGTAHARFFGADAAARPFPLEPCSFALTDFTWLDGSRASVGLYPDGQICLAHPKADELTFHWSQGGTRDANGNLIFDLAFVPSPATELLLELPEELKPFTSAGMIKPSERESRAGTKSWLIYPGAARRIRLTVASAGPDELREQLGFRQTLSYRVAESGTDLVSRFLFDAGTPLPGEVTVILDQPLITAELEWINPPEKAVVLSQISSLGTTKLQIRAPEQTAVGAPELSVGAFAPFRRANHWRLPGTRLLSDRLFWRETLAKLAVIRPLIATGFETLDSAQTYDRYALRPPGQDIFSFKYFEPNGQVAILLSETKSLASFSSASEILLDPQEVSAKTDLLIEAGSSDTSGIRLDIAEHWEIETIKETSGESLYWTAAKNDRGRDTLDISFRKRLPAGESCRIQLTGRYLGETEESTPFRVFSPLDLSRVLTGRHLIAFHSAFPYQVRFVGADDEPIEPVPVGESMAREIFSQAPLETVLDLGPRNVPILVRLDKTSPAYSGAIRGYLSVSADTLNEEWRIECVPPAGARIDRVLVAFHEGEKIASADSNTSENDWIWGLTSENNRAFLPTRLAAEEVRSLGIPDGTEVWDVRLLTSRSVPFELVASRFRPRTAEMPVPLLFLPETASQTAELTVESLDAIPLTIQTVRIRPIPADLAEADRYETVVGSFRYQPEQLVEPNGASSLTILEKRSSDGPGEEMAWCWFLRADSQYEPTGVIRNHLSCFIESRGRREMTFRLPRGLGSDAVHAVWADDERITWYPDKTDGVDAVRIALPERKRYVTVSIEYHEEGEPLSRRRRLIPHIPTIDMPILSGSWVAWFPPEYLGYSSSREFFRSPSVGASLLRGNDTGNDFSFWRRLRQMFRFGESLRTRTAERLASLFLERLGDPALRNDLLHLKRKTLPPAARSAKTVLTWGDIFANPEIVERLFPLPKPEPSGPDTEDTEEEEPTVRIFVNRTALSRSRIFPTDEIVLSDSPSAVGRALGAMETSGMVLLFLRPDVFCVTTMEERREIGDDLIPLGSDRLWLLQDSEEADRILAALEENVDPNFVSAEDWRGGAIGIPNPWQVDQHASGFTFVTPGWNSCRRAIEEANVGILVLNRYQLASQKWFMFLLVIVLTWRGPLARPSVLIALFGLGPVLHGFVSPPVAVALTGVSFGALCSLGFLTLRRFSKKSAERREPEEAETEKKKAASAEPDDSEPGFVPLNQIRPRPSRSTEPSNDTFLTYNPASTKGGKSTASSLSLPDLLDRPETKNPSDVFGFELADSVLIEQEPVRPKQTKQSEQPERPKQTEPLVRLDATKTAAPPIQNGDGEKPTIEKRDFPPEEKPNGEKESGRIKPLLSLVLAIAAAAGVWAIALAQEPNREALPAASASESTFTAPENAGSPGDSDEPFRVFVPVDEQYRPLPDDYIWVSEPFHRRLTELIDRQEHLSNPWRLTAARYEGTVNYNSFSQTLSLFHLKATFTVELETSRAVIRLPMMTLPPDGGAKFDRQPIYPIFQQEGNELLFEINRTTPGIHTLELILTTQPFGSEGGKPLEIAIPRIPDAVLELSLPPDTPPIRVGGALGAVTQSADLLTARLGPTGRMTIEKQEEPGRIGQATIEAEQLFLLRARPNQTTLSGRFRFRISGGRVQTLYLQNDPRYALLQCVCDEAELEPSIQRESASADLIKIVFKKPVSGNVTVRADYAIRDFSGIGRIRLPRIRAARARVTRSWLALFESPSVEIVKLFPSEVAVGTFQNAWEGSETPLAVYDLLRPDPEWAATIKLRAPSQSVREETAVLFEGTESRISYNARFVSTGEVFHLSFGAPEIFTVDSVTVRDFQGDPIEAPETFFENGRLHLFFRAPLFGEYQISVLGRAKPSDGRESAFPVFAMENVERRSIALELFYVPSVWLNLKTPPEWTNETGIAPRSDFDADGAIFAGSWFVPDDGSLAAAQVSVRPNTPKISGVTRSVLFNRLNERWEILTDYFLEIRDGELDRFEIELDEICAEPVTVDPNLAFEIRERDKTRILTITPQHPVSGQFAFRLRAPLAGGSETLRLPRLRLLAPGGKDYQPLAQRVFLPAVDPVQRIQYQWDVENLRPVEAKESPAPEASEEKNADDSAQHPLPAVSALIAATLPSDADPLMKERELFPAVVTQLSGLTKDDFHQYEATGGRFIATFSPGHGAMQVLGAETCFFIRTDGAYYGETIMDARLGKADHGILILPSNARLLKTTLDGIGTSIESAGDGRWRIDFVPGAASRRLAVLFYVPPEPTVKEPNLFRPDRVGLSRLRLAPARIESVPTLRSYWAAVFESDGEIPLEPEPCHIVQNSPNEGGEATSLKISENPPPFSPADLLSDESGWRMPVGPREAMPIMLRLNLEKMEHLLDMLELSTNTYSTNDPDYRRWYARWLQRWWNCRNEVDSQFAAKKTPMAFSDTQRSAVFQKLVSGRFPITQREANGGARSDPSRYVENTLLLREATEQNYRDILDRYARLLETSGLAGQEEQLAAARYSGFSSFSLWRLNHRRNGNLFLIGLTNADLESVVITRPAADQNYLRTMMLAGAIRLAIVLVTIFFICGRGFRRWVVGHLWLIGALAGTIWAVVYPATGGTAFALFCLAYQFIRVRLRNRAEAMTGKPKAAKTPET